MSEIPVSTNESILFTSRAAEKVWSLIQEDGNLQLKLRVYVTGGGCSGFQYGFTFDEIVNDDDTIIKKIIHDENAEVVEVFLLCDALSIQYLSGAEIDYKQDVNGEQFIIRNPNAKTTCGCGSSFSTE